MQKFAAHYMLSPEGFFRKWPLISVADDGRILEVQTSPDGLKEQPGISFFAGILVPAFIDVWLTGTASSDHRIFNRHFSQGTLIMNKPVTWTEQESRNTFPLLCSCPAMDPDDGLTGRDMPLWERIRSFDASDVERPFPILLHRITTEAACHAGISNAGRLEPDASPGILVIRHADLTGPALTPGAGIKWLNVPSPACFESLTQETK